MRSVVDCAHELAIPLVTIHFWIDRRFIDEAVIQEKIGILEQMVEYAVSRHVVLCIENLSEKPSDFLPAFEAIHDLNMTLDIGHAELLSEANRSYEFSSACMDRIRHVHIHDNKGGNSPEDDIHLPLGRGTIDFVSILSDLRQKGYDKTITLEVKPEFVLAGKELIEAAWKDGNE